MFDMRPYRNNNDRRNNLSAYNPFREMDAFERNFFNDPFAAGSTTARSHRSRPTSRITADSYTLEPTCRALTRRTSISMSTATR